ncbi:hypothetical protein [Aeromicrobium sp. Leaf350]|uniref:hypothetical protein n=1 Tax=Aeromicrobium sp. Leaf350 TaxID=2876565 RepID=UPI001E5E07E1|nr:hypothetical protein [Aeromicrobium sp. Leaf350]
MDRPFPWGLLVIAVLLGWGTLTLEDGWAQYGGLAAVVVVAGALAYQITQRDKSRAAEKRRESEEDVPDPWDEA